VSEGRDVGNMVAGLFLVVFGLCLLLVGGGCSALWVSELSSGPGQSLGWLLLLFCLAIAATGVWMIVAGVRMVRGGGG
jgi:hypothetical protein